jgi:hypothetical protein
MTTQADEGYTREEIAEVHRNIAGALGDFRATCQKAWMETQARRPPRTLYHYTSAQVFRSIIENGTVWASDVRYMNDSSEVAYAASFFKQAISEAAHSLEDDDEQELLARIGRTFNLVEMARVFAFCCSEDPDSIPQWVAYGARRGGFALGLELGGPLAVSTVDRNSTTARVASLLKVEYDPGRHREVATAIVSLLLPMYRAACENLRKPLRTFVKAEICQATRDALFPILISFKQPGFRHEREWRVALALDRREASKFDVRPMGLVPYVPLKLTHFAGVLPLRELIQGRLLSLHWLWKLLKIS